MKKKDNYLLVSVILIIVIILLFCITRVFKNKTPSKASLDNASYAMVKTHNINTRTQVSFPVFNDFKVNEKNSDDFEKEYTNDNNSKLYVIFHKLEGTPSDDFVTYKYDVFKSLYEEDKYLVNSSNIKCNHTCRRYQVYLDDNIYLDVVKVFIEFSKEDIFELTYEQKKADISDDIIETIVNNIYITNDASYMSGVLDEEYLRITLNLLNYARLHINFDGSKYEEVEDGDNSIHQTTIRNINNDSTSKLGILFSYPKESLLETLDTYYKTNSRNKIKIGDKEGYEYSLDNKKAYAIILDNDSALIFDGSIKPNDIKRIFIEKDDNE